MPRGMHFVRIRVVAGLVSAGIYIVGGALLLMHLVPGSGAAAEVGAREVVQMTRLTIYSADGRTYVCNVPVAVAASDAIVGTTDDLLRLSRVFDCR